MNCWPACLCIHALVRGPVELYLHSAITSLTFYSQCNLTGTCRLLSVVKSNMPQSAHQRSKLERSIVLKKTGATKPTRHNQALPILSCLRVRGSAAGAPRWRRSILFTTRHFRIHAHWFGAACAVGVGAGRAVGGPSSSTWCCLPLRRLGSPLWRLGLPTWGRCARARPCARPCALVVACRHVQHLSPRFLQCRGRLFTQAAWQVRAVALARETAPTLRH